MPDEHAKLSPSAFGRWGKCPASVRMTKDLPDQTSEAAQWGTDSHLILEALLHKFVEMEKLIDG